MVEDQGHMFWARFQVRKGVKVEGSGEGVGLGKRALFLWKKDESLNRSSKG